MAKNMIARWVKGTLVSAVAAVVCYWLWASLREWAWDVGLADRYSWFAGSVELLVAGIAGVASMPVLLWAGMRLLGERGNHLLVLLGAMAWIFIGGHVVEGYVSAAGTAVFLALFAALASVLSLVEVPQR
jgi:hypothetical protein